MPDSKYLQCGEAGMHSRAKVIAYINNHQAVQWLILVLILPIALGFGFSCWYLYKSILNYYDIALQFPLYYEDINMSISFNFPVYSGLFALLISYAVFHKDKFRPIWMLFAFFYGTIALFYILLISVLHHTVKEGEGILFGRYYEKEKYIILYIIFFLLVIEFST